MDTIPESALGTLLRALIDQLDPAVEAEYGRLGLDFRPRFTPVVRTLARGGPMRIKDIAQATGVSHSAVSQTVSVLVGRGWVQLEPGRDNRERIVHLTDDARAQLPELERQWTATAKAAASLGADIGVPLEQVLRDALAALRRSSFAERLRAARSR